MDNSDYDDYDEENGFNEYNEYKETVKSSKFDPKIVHKPKIEFKEFQIHPQFEVQQIKFFSIGLNYKTVITKNDDLYFYKNTLDKNVEIKNFGSIQQMSILEKYEKTGGIITKSLKLLIGQKEKSGKIFKIKKIYPNKNGDCILFVTEEHLLLGLPEFNEFRMLISLNGIEVQCVEFIESFKENTELKKSFSFFYGTDKGVLKYGKINIDVNKSVSSDKFLSYEKIEIFEFKTKENQYSTINGICLFQHKKKNNFFILVDKRLFYLPFNSSVENLVSNFTTIFSQSSKEICSSEYAYNQLYGVEGYHEFTYSLLFYTRYMIKIITLNLQNYEISIEEIRLYDKDNRALRKTSDQLRFHPFFYHYVLIDKTKFIVMSILTKNIVYQKDFEEEGFQIGFIDKDNNNGNLLMEINNKVFEVKIINEVVNSWIHLVKNNLEELAYFSAGNFNIEDQDKCGKILAHKFFKNKDYLNAIKMFFKSKESFEIVISKIFELDYNENDYFNCLSEYIIFKIDNYIAKSPENDVIKILLMVLLEIISFKYLQIKKLYSLKNNNQEQNININVTKEEVDNLNTKLKSVLQKYLSYLKENFVLEILRAHGNFEFCSYFLELNQDYENIIIDCYFSNKYRECITKMREYFENMDQIKKKEKLEKRKFFAVLVKKHGFEFTVKLIEDFLIKVEIIEDLKRNKILSIPNNPQNPENENNNNKKEQLQDKIKLLERERDEIIKNEFSHLIATFGYEKMLLRMEEFKKKLDKNDIKIENQIKNFANLIELYSKELFLKQPKLFTSFLEKIFRISNVEKYDESFFLKSLNFLSYANEEKNIVAILNLIFNFVRKLKKTFNQNLKKKIENIQSSLSNILIYNYVNYSMFDELDKFVLLFEYNSNNFSSFSGFLIMMIENIKQAVKVKISIFGVNKQYYNAVQLALSQRDKLFQDLAIKWASKPKNNNLKKKLWLLIAKKALQNSQDSNDLIELLNNSICPLKISDIIIYFEEDQKISSFKELIEKNLNDYNKKIISYNNKLANYQKISDHLTVENQNLDKKFQVFDLEKKCNICDDKLFKDIFYFYNCSHTFHRECLKKKFEEMGLGEKLENIKIAETEIQRILAKSQIRLKKNPIENAKEMRKIVKTLSETDFMLFNMFNKKLDDIYSHECIFCGDIIINWSYDIIKQDKNIFKLS